MLKKIGKGKCLPHTYELQGGSGGIPQSDAKFLGDFTDIAEADDGILVRSLVEGQLHGVLHGDGACDGLVVGGAIVVAGGGDGVVISGGFRGSA